MRIIVEALLLTLLLCSLLSAEPLPMRVWQFQDYNMDHIKRLVGMAADAGVNRIQISHQIVMNVEEPLGSPQRVKDINTICDWAHAKGIKVDMWTHELNSVPKVLLKDGKADLDNPKIWEFVRGKYDKLFALCPTLDGLVLTMQETAMSIYHEKSVTSAKPPEQRVAEMINSLSAVCAPRGKDLFIRTFSYEPEELRYIQGGLKLCKADVVVMTKCVPHDWQPYYPHNPAIGDVGGKPQVVEFDLGHEFTGLSTIPYINIDYLKNRLDYAVAKKATGAVIRVERLKWRAVDTPNQADIDVFTQMLLDPSADPHKLYKQWLEKRYGKEAVPYLYSAFMRTQEIVDKGLYALGFWMTNHSMLPRYDYAEGSLRRRSTAKWDPAYKPIEQELYNPTTETITKIDAEKDAALKLVNESIRDLEKAKPFLKAKDYAHLSDTFQREKAMVIVWEAATDVIFGIDIRKATKSESDRKYLNHAADRLAKVTAENKTHLINMAADYSEPKRTRNVDEARRLVDLARATVGE